MQINTHDDSMYQHERLESYDNNLPALPAVLNFTKSKFYYEEHKKRSQTVGEGQIRTSSQNTKAPPSAEPNNNSRQNILFKQ